MLYPTDAPDNRSRQVYKEKSPLFIMGEINNENVIKYPEKSVKLAELVGIILGDGGIYENKEAGVYDIRIAGDSVKDRDYMLNYVKPLMDELFNINVKVYFFKNRRCVHLKFSSVRLVEFLKNIGLKSGNKIKTQVTIPDWIKNDLNFLSACLRGLIDTDGSIYELLPNWPGLFQINFQNYNQTLLKDVRNSFLNLGYNISKISMGTKIYLTRKDNLNKFYKEVGFSNPKHRNKYSPVVQRSNLIY